MSAFTQEVTTKTGAGCACSILSDSTKTNRQETTESVAVKEARVKRFDPTNTSLNYNSKTNTQTDLRINIAKHDANAKINKASDPLALAIGSIHHHKEPKKTRTPEQVDAEAAKALAAAVAAEIAAAEFSNHNPPPKKIVPKQPPTPEPTTTELPPPVAPAPIPQFLSPYSYNPTRA